MGTVRFETWGSLGRLTLANPPLNLFSEELIKDLRTAVNQAEQLPLRALLVRADGKVFSGGADVSIFKGKTANEARERFTSHLRTIAHIEELPFPTIAVVQGACMAAGLELALASDLIWAGSPARFGQVDQVREAITKAAEKRWQGAVHAANVTGLRVVSRCVPGEPRNPEGATGLESQDRTEPSVTNDGGTAS